MTLPAIDSVVCGAYTIVRPPDAPLWVDAETVVLVAEATYLVKLTPEADRTALRGALTLLHDDAQEGQLRFGNFVGHTRLGDRTIRVESNRLSFGRVEQMLEEITDSVAALPFTSRGPVTSGAGRRPHDDPDVLYQRFALIRHALTRSTPYELPAAVARIIGSPHEVLQRQPPQPVPLESARRVDGPTLLGIAQRPERLMTPTSASRGTRSPVAHLLGGRLPADILYSERRPTRDTPENRFVLYVLETMAFVLKQVEQRCVSWELPSAPMLQQEARELTVLLSRWINHPAFDGIQASPAIPMRSTVLRGRPGYREVLRFWLDLLAKSEWLPPEAARLGLEVRDLATLYELWCFFQMVQAVERVTGATASLVGRSVTEEQRMTLTHGANAGVQIGAAAVYYNRTFSRRSAAPGSYSVPLRPDISLRTADGVWHLLDAKCKLNVDQRFRILTDDSQDHEDGSTSFKTADLHKMHAYRDAIGARSVWVLYPGEGASPTYYAAESPPTNAGVPDGVGAIPLQPGRSAASLDEVMCAILGAPHSQTPTPRS